jgi:hypothetical protein
MVFYLEKDLNCANGVDHKKIKPELSNNN